jgi:uncharacterized protein (TIGR02145 family)
VASGSGKGAFYATLSGLSRSTLYYIRAFANNNISTNYGNQIVLKMPYSMIEDIDGNQYPTVIIGEQIWMSSNIKTTRFRDGTIIDNVIDDRVWVSYDFGSPAWSYYNHDRMNDDIVGKLYNIHTISNNLCPLGWRIPSDNDWSILANFLGVDAGHKLKINKGWSNNGSGSNESWFNAYPSGFRWSNGAFNYAGIYATFWTSTFFQQHGLTSKRVRYLSSTSRNLEISNDIYWGSGHSVRCIQN